ncbi:MAG: FliM/FliN family flagellar motor switch protein [Pseudomonadota bacterium]
MSSSAQKPIAQKPILARKADHVRASRPVAPTPRAVQASGAIVAVERAAKRAALPYPALELEPRDAKVTWGQSLEEVVEVLPEGGLLAVLENSDRQRGLIHLHQGLLDALIEVQTTGMVDTVAGPNRPATAIDCALSMDYINAVTQALVVELDRHCAPNLVAEMNFGTLIEDRKHLPLLLPQSGFHLFTAATDIAEARRTGSVVLAVPGPHGDADDMPLAQDPEWTRAWHATIAQAVLPFSAILVRKQISLQRVMRLEPGDTIPFESESLSQTVLEDDLHRTVMKGHLGQVGGKRALRLSVAALRTVEGEVAPPVPEAGFAAGSPVHSPVHSAGQGAGHVAGPDAGQGGAVAALPAGAPSSMEPAGGAMPEAGAGSAALGEAGLPPLGEGGLPPLGEGGLPPLGEGGLPPLGEGGLPPLGEGGLPPLGDSGLPPLGEGGLPPLGEGGLPDLPKPA